MPPKKRKGKKTRTSEGELTVDDKFKKTLEEIEALKDHLAIRKDLVRRSKEVSEQWKERMLTAEYNLEDVKDTHRAVSADMTRQYKTMQVESIQRIQHLETELAQTKARLDRAEQELHKTKEERDRVLREKEIQIEILNMKVNSMSGQYEYLFNEYMDKLVDKMTLSKVAWEKKSTSVQSNNKKLLLDFGLNPLDI